MRINIPNTTRYFRRPTNPFGSTGIFNPLHTTRPIQTEPIVTYGLSLFQILHLSKM